MNGNIGIGIPCSAPSGVSTYGVTYTYNVVAGLACGASTSAPVSNSNTGGVSMSGVFANSAIGGLDVTGGPYSWEDTWASCPLAVDHNGTRRSGTCTAGGYQR